MSMKRKLVLALFPVAVAAGVGASAEEWRPAERWRGFNLMNMFIKANAPDPAPGENATGFLYANPQEYAEADFRMIRGWGFNFVRLPLDYRYWIKDDDWTKFDETAVGFLDRAIERGRRHGVHVQLCFHRAPGYFVSGPDRGDLFSDPEAQRVCALHWAFFARRYKGIPNDALSFNLVNEPPDRVPDEVYAAVAKKLIDAIRAEDPERFIVADGADFGRRPVRGLEGLHNVGQSLHAYFPATRLDANAWPPASADMPQGVFAGRGKEGWYAPFELVDVPPCRAAVRLHRVSGRVALVARADGREVARIELEPKEGDPAWEDYAYFDEWKVAQATYRGPDFTFDLPDGAASLDIGLDEGDWAEPVSVELVRTWDGARAVLPFVPERYADPRNRRHRFVSWDGPAFAADPAPDVQSRFDDPRLECIWRSCLSPWKETLESGTFVMAGEFGPMKGGDEGASLALVSDMLKAFKALDVGWSLWGLYGECGVIDAPRDGEETVDFGGRALDREMQRLLQEDGETKRTVKIDRRFMSVPVTNVTGGATCRIAVLDGGGERLQTLAMRIAKGEPDWEGSMDVSDWIGKTVTFVLESGYDARFGGLDRLRFTDAEPGAPALRDEPTRLQFHYTPPKGWMNDPNGLAWCGGEWRLMYQHAPFSCLNPWADSMFWGYATSPDLVHWTDRGDAVRPPPHSRTLISGSGVVDAENTAGFGAGAHVLVAVDGGLRLWHSLDGRNYEPCEGNPVAHVQGCDPKVVWYAPERKWVMATYGVEDDRWAVFFNSSKNLRDWTPESVYLGDPVAKGRETFLHECPGLAELKVEGEDATAWVVWCAGTEYAVGEFDGREFRPFEERLRVMPTKNTPYYAMQSFANAPDGRCVVVPWYRVPGRAPHFNQAMGLPCDLTLARTSEGLRMRRRPSQELKALRTGPAVPIEAFEGELAECAFICTPAPDATLEWDLRGMKLRYDAGARRLSVDGGEDVPWPLSGGRLGLRAFVDRQGIEVFSADGLRVMAWPDAAPDPANRRISFRGTGRIENATFKVWPLASAWLPRPDHKCGMRLLLATKAAKNT